MHGAEKAAAMTKDLMQSWQQQRLPEGQVFIHSAPASSTVFAPAHSLQSHSQSQIPDHNISNGGVSAPVQLSFRRHEWIPAPVIPHDERSAQSLPHPVAPSTLAPPHYPHIDNLAQQTSVSQPVVAPQECPISDVRKEEMPVHSATGTHLASTFPTAPSSQSHSILAPEEKSSALYTMRGLAASIKRSLNAERLAASEQATATSETSAETRKLSPSDEIVDTTEQPELSTAGTNEPAISPTTDSVEMVPVLPPDGGENERPSSATVPSPFPQVSVSQQETPSSLDEVTIPNSYQEPLHDFVPFSTLAGAVSFDNAASYTPVDHPTMPSPTAGGVLEGLMHPQQAPDVVSHDHIDVPLLAFAEASFNGLSFPTRTPTPPLSAMITPFRDDDGANGKTEATPSSIPTSPCLDQVEIQPESISPASNGPVAMAISADEDQDRICVDVVSLSSEHAIHPEAHIPNSPKVETHAFVRRTGLLDSPIEKNSGEVVEKQRAERYPTSGRSTSHATNSGSSVSLKPPMKSAGVPSFYIAVPPQPEWVRKAKRQEAAKRGLASQENGQRNERVRIRGE
ncbi:hypothetical protein EI94DRAFT_296972 [Lactarius quietus]|nr:hypothetical protein EI94DRAFT_296972 [Lactarius quietus]